MAFRYAAGERMNLLENALSVALTPAADSLFPASNLSDGRPQRPAMHGSNAADPVITADLAAFTPRGTGSEDFTVRTGERRRIVASGATVAVSLQNLSTGKYLDSSGNWQSGATSCLTSAGGLSYQVESLTACQALTVTLRVTVTSGSDVTDWPRWNAAVVMGHNLDVGLTVELRSSTDDFSGSDVLEATASILQPAFWMEASATVENRYARVAITGTNQAVPWYGEVVLCFLEEATFYPGFPIELRNIEAQIRHSSNVGTSFVHNLSPHPRRALKLSFELKAAGEVELREELVWRGRGGAHPMVAVPIGTEPLVIFGRLEDSWTVMRTFNERYEGDLAITEDPIAAPLV